MRPSKLVQYLSFGLLALFPLFVLFRVQGLPPGVYLLGVPAYWALLGAAAALWHRNFEEG